MRKFRLITQPSFENVENADVANQTFCLVQITPNFQNHFTFLTRPPDKSFLNHDLM